MYRGSLFFILLSLLFCVLNVVDAKNPGISTTVTQKGLTYGASVGLAYLQQKLSTVTIPDQSGNDDSISWEISSIEITGLKIPSGTISIDSGKGLTITVSNVAATISANWHGRENVWPHPSASGQATIDVSNTDLNVEVIFSESNGRVVVSPGTVSVSINGFDMHFSGSHLDFILNLLKKLFGGKIKDAAQQALENGISNAIKNDLNRALSTIPSSIPIKKDGNEIAYVDDELVSSEVFTSSYMSIPFNGEFYNSQSKQEAPFQPSSMPDSSSETDSVMFQIFLNQYVPNTASFVFSGLGLLNYTVTPNQIPKSSPIKFNTSDWGPFVPQLPTLFPGWAMQAEISPMSYPLLTFKSEDAVAFGKAYVDMFVISPKNGSLIQAFTLGFNATATGAVQIKNSYVVGNLTYFSSGVWLESTNIGEFDVSTLESLVKFLTEVLILPFLNAYLETGILIPSVQGLEFYDTTIDYEGGYVVLSSNVKYTIPEGITLPSVQFVAPPQ